MAMHTIEQIQRNSVRVFLVVVALVCCGLMCIHTLAKAARSNVMGAEKSEIWRLIDLISVSIPFGKERLEEIFGFSLKEVSRHGDFVFYKGIRDVNHFASIPSGKSFVNELDFRSNAKNPSKSLLIINVDEKVSCVSRDDASAQYPNLEFYESPSPPPLRGGESANRKSTFHTVFSSAQSWGEISFTFSSKDARVIGCLGNVIFSFKKS